MEKNGKPFSAAIRILMPAILFIVLMSIIFSCAENNQQADSSASDRNIAVARPIALPEVNDTKPETVISSEISEEDNGEAEFTNRAEAKPYVKGITESKLEAGKKFSGKAAPPVLEEIMVAHSSASFSLEPPPLKDEEVSAVFSVKGLTSEQVSSKNHLPKKLIGKLTGAEINDFAKWKLWENESREELKRIAKSFGLETGERYCIQLTNTEGWPAVDVKLNVKDDRGNILSEARTDNTGKAELWIREEMKNVQGSALTAFAIAENGTWSVNNLKPFSQGINFLKIDQSCKALKTLDLAIIVDATGSMSDEIDYLKAELLELIRNVHEDNSKLKIRVASVFYRDVHDRYTVEYSDFTSDLNEALKFINVHNADGGGDEPEALDLGIETAVTKLSWSASAAGRLALIVADAPPHDKEKNRVLLHAGIENARRQGIRMIPLVCSGGGKDMEFIMRNIALLTNGTYLFITDDSGIGDAHTPPSTDKFDHKKLNKLLSKVFSRFTRTATCHTEEAVENNSVQEPLTEDSMQNITDEKIKPDQKLNIYPNPSVGKVTVSSKERMSEIQVFDLSGKALERIKTDGKSKSVDFSEYPVGKYIIKAVTGNELQSGIMIIDK
jgi:hypothetical protein